jgi:threonyl-tRNA synthetase
LWLPSGRQLLERLRAWLHALHAQAGYQPLEAQAKDLSAGLYLAFQTARRSHHDLPWRRYQLGRAADPRPRWGLLGLPSSQRDEGLALVSPEQLPGALRAVLSLQRHACQALGLTVDAELLSDGHAPSEAALRSAAAELDLPVREAPGEAPDNGPRLQLRGLDALGRRWDLGWLELDQAEPTRRALSVATSDDGRARPLAVRHSLLGALEPLVALLLEHGRGALPAWLSPEQVRLLPVGEDQRAYADEVAHTLRGAGLRVGFDRQGPLAGRVRAGLAQRVPWRVVIGSREQGSRTASLRARGDEAPVSLSLEELVDALRQPAQPPQSPLTWCEHPDAATVAARSSEDPQGGYRH